jgi:hypothetical protein
MYPFETDDQATGQYLSACKEHQWQVFAAFGGSSQVSVLP